MGNKLLGVPRIVIIFVLMVIVPVLLGEFVLYQEIVLRAIEAENACNARVVVQEPLVKPTPEPTATPSPTLKPRIFVPVVVTPTGVK